MLTSPLTRRRLLLALGMLSAGTGRSHADDDDDDDDSDHNRASAAVGQGRALPLADLLSRLGPQLGGEVIGVDFKRKNGRYVYKLKVVTPAGKIRELSVDAMTGGIVKED